MPTFDYHMHEYMLRTFEPFLPKGRALELGCYQGAFTERLTALYDDLTVVEGASELIDVAQSRVGKSPIRPRSIREFRAARSLRCGISSPHA